MNSNFKSTIKKAGAVVVSSIVLGGIAIGGNNASVVESLAKMAFSAPYHQTQVASPYDLDTSLFNVPQSVAFGQNIDLSSIAIPSSKLVSPSGRSIDDFSVPIVVDEIGYYHLIIGDNNTSLEYYQDFYIESYIKYTPVLEVNNNGADIPTYVAEDAEITLPNAEIVVYDENNVRTVIPTNNMEVDVKSDVSTALAKPGDKIVAPNSNSTIFITYRIQDGASGIPYTSKDFKVKVQKGFEDSQKPKVSVSTPQYEGNVNVKYSLPVATGSDDYDANLKYRVVVTAPDGANVKDVVVDSNTGYAISELGTDTVFDNGKRMYFYPTSIGTYTITYVATDDSGVDSDVSTFHITVGDKTAPLVKGLEQVEYKIPTKFAASVKRRNPSTSSSSVADSEEASHIVNFPKPVTSLKPDVSKGEFTVVDNAIDSTSLKARFTLKDPDGHEIFKFSDTIVGTDKNEAVSDDTPLSVGKGIDIKDSAFGDGFDFSSWKDAVTEYNKNATTRWSFEGKYTAEYRFIDAKGQVTLKSYDIQITNEFEDLSSPTVEKLDVANKIKLNDRLNFVLPKVEVADDNSTRLNVVYSIVGIDDAAAQVGTPINIKGGEKLWYISGTLYVSDKASKTDVEAEKNIIDINGATALKLSYMAYDELGNVSISDNNSAIKDENQNPNETIIKLVDISKSTSATFAIDGTNIHTDDGGNPFGSGKIAKLGNFSLGSVDAKTNNIGVEVSIREPDVVVTNSQGTTLTPGSIVQDVTSTVSYDESGHLTVSNITFKPSKGYDDLKDPAKGQYTLVLRAFDIYGNNVIKTVPILVEHEDDGIISSSGKVSYASSKNNDSSFGTKESSQNNKLGRASSNTQLPNTVEVGNSYDLQTYTKSNDPTGYYSRTITGGLYEIVNDTFTPKSVGAFSFVDEWNDGSNPTNIDGGAYKTTATSSEDLTITVNGVPNYLEVNDNKVSLPQPTANIFGVTFDKPVIKRKDTTIPVEGNSWDAGYTFVANQDGQYTLTYNASFGDKTASQTFTIYVGNVTSPTIVFEKQDGFTTTGKGKSTELTFTRISFNDSTDFDNADDKTEFTVNKSLIDPSGSKQSVTGAENQSSYTLDKVGNWTVQYDVTDSIGNTTTKKFFINITSDSTRKPTTIAAITTTLIVVGVVLIAGSVVYLTWFRRVKKDKMPKLDDKASK